MGSKGVLNPIFYLCMILKACVVAMMVAIASLTFYQVVMRYGLNRSSSWSEEAVRFIFIWCSFLAIAMGVRDNIHIGINVVVELFSKKIQAFIEVVGYIAMIVFSGYLVFYGWQVVVATGSQTSPGLGIPMSWVYASVPTMGALIVIFGLEGAYKVISGNNTDSEEA